MKIQAPPAYTRIAEPNRIIEAAVVRKSVASRDFQDPPSSTKEKSVVEANPHAPAPVLGSHIDLRV
jgi:hypothetical protein